MTKREPRMGGYGKKEWERKVWANTKEGTKGGGKTEEADKREKAKNDKKGETRGTEKKPQHVPCTQVGKGGESEKGKRFRKRKKMGRAMPQKIMDGT